MRKCGRKRGQRGGGRGKGKEEVWESMPGEHTQGVYGRGGTGTGTGSTHATPEAQQWGSGAARGKCKKLGLLLGSEGAEHEVEVLHVWLILRVPGHRHNAAQEEHQAQRWDGSGSGSGSRELWISTGGLPHPRKSTLAQKSTRLKPASVPLISVCNSVWQGGQMWKHTHTQKGSAAGRHGSSVRGVHNRPHFKAARWHDHPPKHGGRAHLPKHAQPGHTCTHADARRHTRLKGEHQRLLRCCHWPRRNTVQLGFTSREKQKNNRHATRTNPCQSLSGTLEGRQHSALQSA
jgi:hypothetical protein